MEIDGGGMLVKGHRISEKRSKALEISCKIKQEGKGLGVEVGRSFQAKS